MMNRALFSLLVVALASNSVALRGKDTNSSAAFERDLGLGPRIIGGSVASQGEFPFFVEWDGCGASLIHEDIILTAAHCAEIKTNTVLVGAYKDQSTKGGAQFRTITARRTHPSFNKRSLNYDFLVMKLNSPVSTTPVTLNSSPNYPVNNQLLTVIGFGSTTDDDNSGSSTLMKVDVNYIETTTCSQQVGETLKGSVELCAGVDGGGKDHCFGDSGGPLFDSQGVQVGVVSYANTYKCAEAGSPGVYSRVSGAIDWINQQICAMSSNPPTNCLGGGNLQPTKAPMRPSRRPTPRPTRRWVRRTPRPTPRFRS